jgi:transketolase
MNITKSILQISKKKGLSHIGSCLSVLPILEEIYSKKKPEDKVLLDNGHSHLTHLHFTHPDRVEELLDKYGIHCDIRAGCDSSAGSLGHNLGIGIGMALVNRKRKVHVVVSDGSMMEGSNWEALRIADKLKLDNLIIYCNFNGSTALEKINTDELYVNMDWLGNLEIKYYETKNGKGFAGVQGHYKVI